MEVSSKLHTTLPLHARGPANRTSTIAAPPPADPQADELALAQLCVGALATITEIQQRIEQAKRTLWALTSAARPERRKIEAMTRELEDLSRKQQAEFMRAVAEASTLWRRLDDEPSR